MTPQAFRLWFYHKRFIFLFIALLIPYFVHPLIDTQVLGISLLDVSFTFLLFTGVWVVSTRRHVAMGALVVVLVSQILTWTSSVVDIKPLVVAGFFLNALYLGYVAYSIQRHMEDILNITSNVIFASLCVYLLFAFTWAFLYAALQAINPQSFYINPHYFDLNTPGILAYSELYYFMYFSFTTLTTLGFGDIMPAAPWARVLASFEAMVGNLYLVVMVSRMVGMQINDLSAKQKR